MEQTRFIDDTAKTEFLVGTELMATKQGTLAEMRVNDDRTLSITSRWSTGANRGQNREPSSATILVYDPDRETSGTATAGSTTTLVDATTLTQVDDFWNGMPITITANGTEYLTEITDFVNSTGTLTFNAIPEAVTADDTFVINGYPTLQRTAAAVSGGTGSYDLDGTNCSNRPGTRYVVYRATFTDGVEEFVGKMTIRAAAYVG